MVSLSTDSWLVTNQAGPLSPWTEMTEKLCKVGTRIQAPLTQFTAGGALETKPHPKPLMLTIMFLARLWLLVHP